MCECVSVSVCRNTSGECGRTSRACVVAFICAYSSRAMRRRVLICDSVHSPLTGMVFHLIIYIIHRSFHVNVVILNSIAFRPDFRIKRAVFVNILCVFF